MRYLFLHLNDGSTRGIAHQIAAVAKRIDLHAGRQDLIVQLADLLVNVHALAGLNNLLLVSSTEGFTVGDTVNLSASGWTAGSGLASTVATVASVTSTTVLVLTYVSGGPWVAGTYTAQTGTLTQTGGTSVSVKYATAYTSTPTVVVTPTSNAGAFYISASSTTGFAITYTSSGTQTFNYIVVGNPS